MHQLTFILNIFIALLYVIWATSSADIFLTSAIFWIVYIILEESFLVPRFGSGDKYGLSVSTNILSKGTKFITSVAFFEFLNVIGPAKDI